MLKCANRNWCPFSKDGCHEALPRCGNYRPDYSDAPPEPKRDWEKINAALERLRVRRVVGGVVQGRCRGCGKFFRLEDLFTLADYSHLGRRWCEDCAEAYKRKASERRKNKRKKPPVAPQGGTIDE
jgi:hypothetical protein